MVAPTPTRSDVLEYLKIVKNKFQDKPGKYNTFLEVLLAHKARRIGMNDLIISLKDLFKDEQELVLGFNSFLPEGYAITLEEDQTTPNNSVNLSDMIDFVNKVKTRFQDDDRAFTSFSNVLKGNKSIIEVYHEVIILFRDHHDLLVEFSHLLLRNREVIN